MKTKYEMVEECLELMENGCGIVEIFEYIEENSDLDPTEIIDAIYKKQVFMF